MNDYVDEIRINDFILSLKKDEASFIEEIKKYAIENNVPIIRDETVDFLKMILKIYKPKNILEIGTAIAYSTNIINNVCKNSNIITIENFDKRIAQAKKNIKTDNIQLIEDDATNFLKNFGKENFFDFIFLDAAKAQYIVWLPYIKKYMKSGAILLSDNIFKDGEILESKFLIKKRDRTIHKRMKDFLYTISNDSDMDTFLYNIGDGISVSIKK